MEAGDWKSFYQAADEGHLSLVQWHLKKGVDPNYQHPEIQMTALVTAIENGHTSVALTLLDNGADPHLESYFHQRTPLEAALKVNDTAVLAALKSRGARLSLWQRLAAWVGAK